MRDFAYRFMSEFGGAGTEGPARINDAWVGYLWFAIDRRSTASAENPRFGGWYVQGSWVELNWMRVDVDRLNPAGPGSPTPFGPAPATPPLGVEIGQDYDVWAVRTQFAF